MRPPELFISYARDDNAKARLFAEGFAQEGFGVWWDAALHSGETFDEVIEKELRAAKAVVVLWSPRSVASRWVRAEATIADRMKTLAPAIIEACDRPIIFELTHTVDLSRWNGDRSDGVWRNYIQDLRRMTGAADPRAAAPHGMMFNGSRQDSGGAPPPATPQPGFAGNSLSGDNIESLISAISSLQRAIGAPAGRGDTPPPPAPAAAPAPAPAPAPAMVESSFDESEATQFFTHSDETSIFNGSQVHCLELREGDEMTRRFLVRATGAKIGRSAPADIILPDSKVSRTHCMVELKDGELFVADLNSTNGSFVDGNRVTGAAVLPAGSTLQIGPFSLHHEVRSWSEL